MTFPITEESHLKWDFARGGSRYSPDDLLTLEIGECRRMPGRAFDEAVLAAKAIAASTPRRLWLCMSGGIDSEAMTEAFLAAQVEFSVAILKFPNRLNWFDIKHAIRFCDRRNIPYTIFPFDVLAFYDSGRYFQIAHKYRCRSPQLAVHLELISKIDGVPVLPWEPPLPKLTQEGQLYLTFPNDHFLVYQRYLEQEGRDGVPYFFLYTPELIYSFIRTTTLQTTFFNSGVDPTCFDSYQLKLNTYKEGGFSVEPRKSKYTGFEKVKLEFQRRFKTNLPIYDQYFRYPMERAYPEPIFQIRLSSKYLRV